MYQSLTVIGNVGKDAEMKFTPSGQAVTQFSIASTRQYTSGSGEKVKETTWFRVTVWGKLAETCNQYVKKGMKVLVEGILVADKVTGGPKVWTKQDGTSGSSFEVKANTVRFLSSAGDHEATPEAQAEEAGEFPF